MRGQGIGLPTLLAAAVMTWHMRRRAARHRQWAAVIVPHGHGLPALCGISRDSAWAGVRIVSLCTHQAGAALLWMTHAVDSRTCRGSSLRSTEAGRLIGPRERSSVESRALGEVGRRPHSLSARTNLVLGALSNMDVRCWLSWTYRGSSPRSAKSWAEEAGGSRHGRRPEAEHKAAAGRA